MLLVGVLLGMGVLALVTPVLTRRWRRDAGYPLAVAFLVAVGVVLTRAPDVVGGRPVDVSLPWIPQIGVRLALRLDGLALLFVLLVLGVGALVMAYSARYLSPARPHTRLYTILVVFATAMLGLVLAADAITLFVFWELTSICSFFLIGGQGTKGARPAMRALIVTGGGGLALLAAMVALTVVTGTSDLTALLSDPVVVRESPWAPTIAVLIIVAALTKSAQLPLHFWLPEAMVALTPVSAYLHAATMVKAGIYLLMRFSPAFSGTPYWASLVVIGLATAVFGALLALKQRDLKALLAYSTISQLGFLVALTGVGTAVALAAAAAHTVAHALFKATLFMLVGIIDREAGSRDIRDLSGLHRQMPVTAALTGLAALSLAGLPPTLGFVSKETIFQALYDAPGAWWYGPAAAGVAVVAAGLTFAYAVRIVLGAFSGPVKQHLYEPARSFLAPAALPAVAGVVLGLTAGVLDPLVDRSVSDTLGASGVADLALWHGLSPELFATLAAYAVGTALYLRAGPVDGFLHRRRAPVTGAALFDSAYAATLSVGASAAAPSLRPSPRASLLPLAVLAGALGVFGVVGGLGGLGDGATGPAPAPASRGADWVVVAVVAIGVLALAGARSRLAAIALLGVVGFAVAIWFQLAGAPDLVLTQVLVEILTVVVAVLVLRRLPETFRRVPPRTVRRSGAIAVIAGVGAGVATWGLTGRRELSAVGATLLRSAEPETGGTNVVNTVLVDFRGLDTLGEIGVLAIAALGVAVLLPGPSRPPGGFSAPVVLRTTQRVVGPLLLVFAAYLLLRGHYQPGGGFIGALVVGCALALQQLTYGPTGLHRLRWVRPRPLLWGGLGLAVLVGLGPLAGGRSFLTPLKVDLPLPGGGQLGLSTSLLFDVGVLLVVVGLVALALDRLATEAGTTR